MTMRNELTNLYGRLLGGLRRIFSLISSQHARLEQTVRIRRHVCPRLSASGGARLAAMPNHTSSGIQSPGDIIILKGLIIFRRWNFRAHQKPTAHSLRPPYPPAMVTVCKAGPWRAAAVALDAGQPFRKLLKAIRIDVRKSRGRESCKPAVHAWKKWDTNFWEQTLGAAVEELGTNSLADLMCHKAARPVRRELELQMFEITYHTGKPFDLHKLFEETNREGMLTRIDEVLEYLEELMATCLRYANAKLRLMRAESAMAKCRTAYRWKDYFDVIRAPKAAVYCTGFLMDCPEKFSTKGRAAMTCYWNLKNLTADPIVATKVRDDSLSSRMLELVTAAVNKITSPKFNDKARFGVLLLLSGLQRCDANLVKYMNFAAIMLL